MEIMEYFFLVSLLALNAIFWGILWIIDGYDNDSGRRFDFWPIIPISTFTALLEFTIFFNL